MTINTVYDVRFSYEEYKMINEIVELKNYLLSHGQEMILLLTEDNLDFISEQIEKYLYNEDTIRGSEHYREVKAVYNELSSLL